MKVRTFLALDHGIPRAVPGHLSTVDGPGPRWDQGFFNFHFFWKKVLLFLDGPILEHVDRLGLLAKAVVDGGDDDGDIHLPLYLLQ